MYIAKPPVQLMVALFMSSLYLSLNEACAYDKPRFEQAVRLFEAGDYASATELFEQLLAVDGDNAIIHYNLGSSYYKLGRYKMARSHFQKIGTRHKLLPAAYYNLGLIAFRLEGSDAAIHWFERCRDSSSDEKLRQLADRQLRLLKDGGNRFSRKKQLSGYFSIGAGYDGNVGRVSDEILDISDHGSAFLDLFLSARYWLNGDHRLGYALKSGGGATNYGQLNKYNSALVNLGIYRYQPLHDGWHSRLGAHYYYTRLDNAGFQQRIMLQVRVGKKYMNNQRLRIQYEYNEIGDLDPAYNYLAGSQQRLNIENRTHLDSGHLRMGYRVELNDRENYQVAASFSSYSPTRQTLYLRYKPTLAESWTAHLGVNYRHSDYEDENIDNGVRLGVRKDKRLRLTLGVVYNYSTDVELELLFHHTENDSTIAGKEYVNKQWMLSIGRFF